MVRASQPATGRFLLSCRAGERPELCRVSLAEFQQFLLEHQGVGPSWAGCQWGPLPSGWRPSRHPPLPPHQELWAVDRLQVQEFMLSASSETPLQRLRRALLFLDGSAVSSFWTDPFPPAGAVVQGRGLIFCSLHICSRCSSPSYSPRRTAYGTHADAVPPTPMNNPCPTTGSPPHNT